MLKLKKLTAILSAALLAFSSAAPALADDSEAQQPQTALWLDFTNEETCRTYIDNAVFSNGASLSVRSKALKLIAPVEEAMRRAAMITAKHEVKDGACIVKLAMSDGVGEIINLSFLCAGEEQAKKIEKNFRRSAEKYYHKVVELMSDDSIK